MDCSHRVLKQHDESNSGLFSNFKGDKLTCTRSGVRIIDPSLLITYGVQFFLRITPVHSTSSSSFFFSFLFFNSIQYSSQNDNNESDFYLLDKMCFAFLYA